MKLSIALRLGRVSNLPTVWSNVLAAMVVATGQIHLTLWVAMCVSMSLFYVGGMFLNDAFDHRIDAQQRAERPIPQGEIDPATVYLWGYSMLGAGIGLTLVCTLFSAGGSFVPFVCAISLAALIVRYNQSHKDNRGAPRLMALCRVMVYLSTVFVAGGSLSFETLGLLALAYFYVAGLTTAARHETESDFESTPVMLATLAPGVLGLILLPTLTGKFLAVVAVMWTVKSLRVASVSGGHMVGKCIGRLIAGIALLDALAICYAGDGQTALLGFALFALCTLFQRRIAGT